MGEVMQVILLSEKTGKTRTLTIMPRHWALAAALAILTLLFASAFFSWVSVQLRLPILQDLILQSQAKAYRESQAVIHNNLQFMATRIGELQAQLQQINSTSERLSTMANPEKPTSVRNKPAGQGGPMIEFIPSVDNLQREIDRLAGNVEHSHEQITLLEASMMSQRVLRRFLPTTVPVKNATLGSDYGFRMDPFNGRRSIHEGLDFTAAIGTPVYAAANGIVVGNNFHGEYGNLIVIDHGLDLVTRYAHLSRTNVNIGQQVKQGQLLGAVGNTGRSSGAHLHFEVRSAGVALNPSVFLNQQANLERGQARGIPKRLLN
jgi:murein DD-endopeptidase MepM/ murein hydrolase activator NlpD